MRDIADVIGGDVRAEIRRTIGSMIVGVEDTNSFPVFLRRLEELRIDEALRVTMEEGERADERTLPRWPTAVWDPL